MKTFYWILVITVLLIIISFLTGCPRKEVKETIIYKKGLTHVIHKTDTAIKWKEKPIYLSGKSIVDIRHDTVLQMYTARDTIKLNGYTIAVYDTLRNDTLRRNLTLLGVDSTEIITIHDSTFVTRVDTVFKNTVTEGGYWKGFRHGAAIALPVGYAAGIATVVLVK